nr:N glycosylase:DNA lyase [Hymenolepis microstoma]
MSGTYKMVPPTRKLDKESGGEWISTNIRPETFNLKSTLNSGQAFRWVEISETQEFVGIIEGRVWRLQQLTPDVSVSFHGKCATFQELENFRLNGQLPSPLVSYFRLDSHFDDFFNSWINQDLLLREFFHSSLSSEDRNRFRGLRLLNQDPRETIFASITSANNNVSRISKLLRALSIRYGKELWSSGRVSICSFPSLESLSHTRIESELREIGFGYRSKFIPGVASKLIAAGGDEFLKNLRNSSYEECKSFLLQLPGVGNKVADCICLSSLNKVEVVPVDIHILRAAVLRGIHPPTSSSSLTDRTYRHVSQRLSELWQPYAGWAQVIVFSIHLHRQSTGAKLLKLNSSKRTEKGSEIEADQRRNRSSKLSSTSLSADNSNVPVSRPKRNRIK